MDTLALLPSPHALSRSSCQKHRHLSGANAFKVTLTSEKSGNIRTNEVGIENRVLADFNRQFRSLRV